MVALTHNIAKKQHRERAQPTERKRWGLLEKKKDYKLRSQDYHKKESHLKLLRKKVVDHNPDEFYHAMVNKKTDKRGILISDRGNETLTNDQAKLLKTQDSGYIRTLTNEELRKIEKLESQLTFGSNGDHIVFVDSEEKAQNFDPAKHFNTDSSLVNRRENRLTKDQLENETISVAYEDDEDDEEDENSPSTSSSKLSKYKQLNQRLERQQQLLQVQREMDLQRELMKKGDKKKVTTKDGKQAWKWKNVRKR